MTDLDRRLLRQLLRVSTALLEAQETRAEPDRQAALRRAREALEHAVACAGA